jgi:ArsR family transcriptional regulator, arsenate/arsenite/antimonite-responsive transcriptional repressor
LIHIPGEEYGFGVELVKIYECLCDLTRLRLLHVLEPGPLCVCHFQAILDEPQVKISKHLAYLRKRGLVKCVRQGNWVVYELNPQPGRELSANLACLQDCARENEIFRRDRARRRKLAPKLLKTGSCGCVAARRR